MHSGVLFTRVERLLVGQLDGLMSLVDGGSARPGMCTRYQISNQSYPSGVSMILFMTFPDCMYVPSAYTPKLGESRSIVKLLHLRVYFVVWPSIN
jgi:hypothetical protein